MMPRTFFVLLLLQSPLVGQQWKQLPKLPDQEGLAGTFAGVSHASLLVAGGANFPDKKPWQGGTKVWHDTIYALDTVDGEWQTIGKLPRPLAYGMSVSYQNTMICVGGSDAKKHYADVFQLEWQNNTLTIRDWPKLPEPLANATGTLVGRKLYVFGGQRHPNDTVAQSDLWILDFAAEKPKWQRGPKFPGSARILPVCASSSGAFWVFGGAELFQETPGKVDRKYLQDAYRLDAKNGWQKIAKLPRAVVGAPSPAPVNERSIDLLGGDDGSQVGVEPTKHQGFVKTILRYDIAKDCWNEVGKIPTPAVTTPCLWWQDSWVIPSGEIRPGIRTPQVWSFQYDR